MSNVEALKTRRSFYNINKDILVSEETILSLIEETVKYTPSAFNSESQRVVVLLNEKHEQVWEMVKAAIKKLVPENEFKKSEDKINAFKAGYGTILFFDDAKTTEALIEKFPLYKANFLKWAIEQNGMLQGNVWVGLSEMGIGASLQHYNELIEEQVKSEFNIDKSWTLQAQMPFGNIVTRPDVKPKKSLSERMVVLK
jgi:predicted oxidoreductase (fatty acid repression mutant protein)